MQICLVFTGPVTYMVDPIPAMHVYSMGGYNIEQIVEERDRYVNIDC